MADSIPLARGMRDLYSDAISGITTAEGAFVDTLESYGYEQIRLPIVERTALFSRGLGESTDAVSKEMFSLESGSESLSLRPEGTASCVRMINASPDFRGGTQKLWYAGSMFRHERPQLGRYREFYQVGAEAFGIPGPDVDVEFLRIVQDVWEKLGLAEEISLDINTLGNAECRSRHRDALVAYLTPVKDQLDEDSQRRLETNPLRILDSKNQSTQALLDNAPDLVDFLDQPTRDHFDEFQSRLQRAGIHAVVNPRLVRGLDYYTHVVFEWNTDQLGAQRQVGGGGRYDGLCRLLGGTDRPAAGFAVGIDRIALLLEKLKPEALTTAPHVYVLAISSDDDVAAQKVANILRSSTSLKVRSHLGGGKTAARFRAADRSGAQVALIIGSEEAASECVTVKWLRVERDQTTIPVSNLANTLLDSDLLSIQ